MQVTPIGTVHSTRKAVTDDHWLKEQAYVELSADYPADALAGLTEFSHVEILFHMHQVDPQKIETAARHPRNNPNWPKVGIFAQRGKNRPNQIGLTTCDVVKVEGCKLFVKGLDAVDGTPVLDIKPCMQEFSPRGVIRQPKWSSELMKEYWDASRSSVNSDRPEFTALQKITSLLREAQIDQAFAETQVAIARFPMSPHLHYKAASICDAYRTENEAVPYYLRALELGLQGRDRRDALLGLASTYRSLGKYEESKKNFEMGIREFPEYRPYQIFLALTEFNLKQYDECVRRLLEQLIDTTADQEIRAYQKALKFYSTRLNEIFD
jgi:tRNA-Thr(GGU) m(6)t(6)A37 methyltransferase TsaA